MKYLFFLLVLLFFGCPATQPTTEIDDWGFIPLTESNNSLIKNSPREVLLNDNRFYKSVYLNSLAVLSDSFKYITINPTSYHNWQECLNTNTKVKLMPGDYTSWGPLKTTKSGTLESPIIIRYYDTTQVSAYNLKKVFKEAIIEGFKLDNVNNIVLTGLTIRGKSNLKDSIICGMKNIIFNSNNIIIDFCNFENVNTSCIRMVNTNDCYIQNNVFQQFRRELNGDGGAVGLQSTRNKTSSGNKIINNEIINYNDGLGFPREANVLGLDTDLVGECLGNVIENNDIYITSLLYNSDSSACAENSMDFKNGTKSKNTNVVINNRCFGNRITGPICSSSGSNGCFITLHRNASGITFKNNILFNGTIGFNILQSDNKFIGESMENLKIENNLLFDLGYSPSSGFIMANTAIINNNTVKDAEYGIFISNSKANISQVKKNLFINIKNIDLELSVTNKYVTGITFKNYTFWYKRWTAPQTITVKNILK